jgi:energy-coupling factor transport system permease protein
VIYRRRASPMHAARAGATCAYCAALAIAALVLSAPVALGAIAVALVGVSVGAGVWPQIRRAMLFALPLGVLVMVVNAIVVRDGLTVIARLGNWPVFGQVDVTLEATVAGAVLGLRAVELILCGALYTAAVDPDEVLRLFRRFSFHSALTATLATRMVPVLARDARRLGDAQRCRPGRPPSRAALMRAATSGVLDRALDVAAALEVRGYGAAQRPRRGWEQRRPYSRHDLAFAAAAAAIVALAIGGRLAGWARFESDPALHAPVGVAGLALAVALLACALLPFADRRGIA